MTLVPINIAALSKPLCTRIISTIVSINFLYSQYIIQKDSFPVEFVLNAEAPLEVCTISHFYERMVCGFTTILGLYYSMPLIKY
jgi:hypothetical protein